MSILARLFGGRSKNPYFNEFQDNEDDALLNPERVRLGSSVNDAQTGTRAEMVTGDDFSPRPARNRHSKLSHLERMTTSPFQKYKQHRRFPVKFVLNILTVTLLTTLYVVKNLQYSVYMDSNTDMIRRRFGDNDNYPQSETGETLLYSVDELYSHMTDLANTYYTFNETSLSKYHTKNYMEMIISGPNGSNTYNTTPSWPLGPLTNMSEPEKIELLQTNHLVSLSLQFRNKQHSNKAHVTVMTVEHKWDCTCSYDLSYDNGRAEFSILISNTILSTSSPILLIISSLIIVAAVPSLLLTARALLKSNEAYIYAQIHLSRPLPPGQQGLMWSDLDFADKLAFFNLWHFTTLLGDVLLILGCSFSFSRQLGNETDYHDSLSSSDICHGLGGFSVWVGILKFMEWDSELYMLILSVKASLARIGKFILTVSPVYMAYVMVGVSAFYDHPDLFGDIFKTSRTLFSVLNGDSVLLVFQELHENADTGYVIFAQIYVYSFCVLYIVIVCNVFIFIVESGYDAALQAVYGDEEELSVFIDHVRLGEILSEAAKRDPEADVLAPPLLEAMDMPPAPSPSTRPKRKRRQSGRSFRVNSDPRSRAKTVGSSHLRSNSLTLGDSTRDLDNTRGGTIGDGAGDVATVQDLQMELLEMHQQTTDMLQALSQRLDAMQAKSSKKGRKRSQPS
eukprot:m.87338 g.87338  ORF g.87338 m.87338 type:complete len:678 (-) comp14772_c0_seq1:92-2125(-)